MAAEAQVMSFADAAAATLAAPCSDAARVGLLHRRTWHVTIRTKHTTIVLLRSQQCPAALALIEALTSVGSHDFSRAMMADRAGYRRSELRQRLPKHRFPSSEGCFLYSGSIVESISHGTLPYCWKPETEIKWPSQPKLARHRAGPAKIKGASAFLEPATSPTR